MFYYEFKSNKLGVGDISLDGIEYVSFGRS